MRKQDAKPDLWVMATPPNARQRIGVIERRSPRAVLVRCYLPDGPAQVGNVTIPLTPDHAWIAARDLRALAPEEIRPDWRQADAGYRAGRSWEQARRDRAFAATLRIVQNGVDRRAATALGRLADVAYRHATGEDRPPEAEVYLIGGAPINPYIQLTPSDATEEERTRMIYDEPLIAYRQAIILATGEADVTRLQAILDDSADAARLLRLYQSLDLNPAEARDLLVGYTTQETRDDMIANAESALRQGQAEAAAAARLAASPYDDPAAAAVLRLYQAPDPPPAAPFAPVWTPEEIAYREEVRRQLPEAFRYLLGEDAETLKLCRMCLADGILAEDLAEVLLSDTLEETDDGYTMPDDPGAAPEPDPTAPAAPILAAVIRTLEEDGAEEIELIAATERTSRTIRADIDRRFPRDLPAPPPPNYRPGIRVEYSDEAGAPGGAVPTLHVPGSGRAASRRYADLYQNRPLEEQAAVDPETVAGIKAGLQRGAEFNTYFSEEDAAALAAALAARGITTIAGSLADQIPRELSATEAADWFYRATIPPPPPPIREEPGPGGKPYPGAPGGDYKLR